MFSAPACSRDLIRLCAPVTVPAASWGAMADPEDNPVAGPLNARPKYVVSNTLTDPGWAHTTVLAGDPAAAVRELKERMPGELQVHGSGQLVRWLAAEGLIDEMILLTYPVIVGQGTRLFPADGPDGALKLVDSWATPGGVTFQVHRPSGRPRYATEVPPRTS